MELAYTNPEKEQVLARQGYKKTVDNYFVIGWFNKDGLADFPLSPDLGVVTSVRISVHKASENWVIISEVCIYLELYY